MNIAIIKVRDLFRYILKIFIAACIVVILFEMMQQFKNSKVSKLNIRPNIRVR